jgi:integrase
MASIQRYEITLKDGTKARRYRVWHRDSTGRNVGKVFSRLRDAEDHVKLVGHQEITGTLADRKAGRQTFRQLWEEVHKAVDYAPATLEMHQWVWRHIEALADKPIGDISPAMVSKVLSRIKAPVMREKARLIVSSMFKYAIAERRVNVNPAKRERRPTTRAARRRERNTAGEEIRRLDMKQLSALTAEIPERYQAMVRLMAHVGLRPGEAYALRVGKVDLLRRTVTVDTAASGSTKTGESRTIPVPTVVADILRDHIAEWSDPNNPKALAFPDSNGGMAESSSFRHTFQRAAKRAGVNHGLRVNDLRHTAAAFAIGNGADVYAVQRMLGHAKPSITLDVYGSLWDQSLERLADKLDSAIRSSWREPDAGKVVDLARKSAGNHRD